MRSVDSNFVYDYGQAMIILNCGFKNKKEENLENIFVNNKIGNWLNYFGQNNLVKLDATVSKQTTNKKRI